MIGCSPTLKPTHHNGFQADAPVSGFDLLYRCASDIVRTASSYNKKVHM
jgi:hypothetical protein